MIAHIDGDILVYRVGFACDNEPWSTAQYVLEKNIGDVIDGAKCEEYEIFLTGKGNFRHEVAKQKEYKGNRKDTPRPTHYKRLREYMQIKHGAVVVDGKEADDELGLRQTDDTVICSIDKDLLMIPGQHYNFVKCQHTVVGDHEGMLRFYQQLIAGDSTDNIPGVPKYGVKKAENIILECEADTTLIFDEIVKLYKSAYGDEWKDVLQEMADLLWIQRKGWERYVTDRDSEAAE